MFFISRELRVLHAFQALVAQLLVGILFSFVGKTKENEFLGMTHTQTIIVAMDLSCEL